MRSSTSLYCLCSLRPPCINVHSVFLTPGTEFFSHNHQQLSENNEISIISTSQQSANGSYMEATVMAVPSLQWKAFLPVAPWMSKAR